MPYNIPMDKLDLQGMTCPMPVIKTKKFLESKIVDEIEVTVDSDAAFENVARFLSTQGFAVTPERIGESPLRGERSPGDFPGKAGRKG